MTCRSRFAPSPTGYLHIGGARTALYSWLQARHQGRHVRPAHRGHRPRAQHPGAIDAILEAMDWMELDYDEGPIYQTQRLDRYREVAEQMVADGTAYYAYETREELEAMRETALANKEKPRYNGAARDLNLPYRDDPNRVIRFKNPLDGVVVLDDLIKGRIEIANAELDDFVIFRPDGWATYNFAVVIDDWDMKITEVIRGDDHVNNTPRQINIYKALGAPLPRFGHMPMILNEEGAKLSKRHGAADVMQYKHMGYLPHALLNYLSAAGLVAWRPGDLQPAGADRPVRPERLQLQARAAGHGQAGLDQPALHEDRRPGEGRAAPGLPAGKAGRGCRRGPGAGGRGGGAARARSHAEGNGREGGGVLPAAGELRRGRGGQAPEGRRPGAAGQVARAAGSAAGMDRRGRVGRAARRGRGAGPRHRQGRPAAARGDHRYPGQPGHLPHGPSGRARAGLETHRCGAHQGGDGLSPRSPRCPPRMPAPIRTTTSTAPTRSSMRWSVRATSADCG
ncbi:glutamate--tRNA ligase [Pseudoxanthomonas sp. NC8]|nr:glutamate--tRNA ligase [Pseudoxanthomonas sp. NC8]